MKYDFRQASIVLLLNSVCVASNVQDSLVGVERTMARFSVHSAVPLRFERVSGSGICIDPKCSVVATASHIQMAAGRGNLKIASSDTSKVLSLANESDNGKAKANLKGGTSPYSMVNDVSFVYTKSPIRHKSGVSYSYRYHVGDKVQVAGYYHGQFITEEAHIMGADVLLQLGAVQLQDNLILDIRLKQGQSGSAVIDEQGQLIGMIVLVGVIKTNGSDIAASVALPVRTIANAFMKLDPSLCASLFDDIPEGRRIPKQTIFQIDGGDNESSQETSTVFPVLTADMSDVPDPVGRLRTKAAASADLLKNLIAKQCFKEPNDDSLCHEVAIINGRQIYREFRKNGKLGPATTGLPNTRKHSWTEYEWAYTLNEIADNRWIFEGLVKDQYLFSFMASAEDDRCDFEEWPGLSIPLFVRRRAAWNGPVACFEQILTDNDFNVLSVFTDWRPPEQCLTEYLQSAIYFSWVVLDGLTSPILLPSSEEIVLKFKGRKQLRYDSVTWTDYRKYRASHKIGM